MPSCSACRNNIPSNKVITHPLLGVPICGTCHSDYTSGEFDVEDGNEIYCRWCGQGEGTLFLCDTCPKSFCERCIKNNFGIAEAERVKALDDRWSCLLCSPQAFRDLCYKHGWQAKAGSETKTEPPAKRSRNTEGKVQLKSLKNVICHDVSRGREKYEIPVINEIDDAKAPLDFTYITTPVAGEGIRITNNPNFLSCCSCTDNCRDASKCECLKNSGGINYDNNGRLLSTRHTIYECNYRCACNVTKCTNRVVGNGPKQRLEIFRCPEIHKGWGVRCREILPPGTFVGDYLGELIHESKADKRGMTLCDEYIYNLDAFGRSNACQKLHDLGLKRSLQLLPRENFVDITCLQEEQIKEYFQNDEALISLLSTSGAITRANEYGQRIPTLSDEALQQEFSVIPITKSTTFTSSSSSSSAASAALRSVNKKNTTTFSNIHTHRSWIDKRKRFFHSVWTFANGIITDRSIIETEETGEALCHDARWYGNIGRFFNHSCNPNLDNPVVFCESHNVLMPRYLSFIFYY